MSQQPTVDMIQAIQTAFNCFNEHLFNNTLEHPIFVMDSRKRTALGYFQPSVWEHMANGVKRHELSLNPLYFQSRGLLDVLSTLVHEMCHLQQEQLGEAPKNAYHNKSWGNLMRSVGLFPSSTGEPGGKRTGIKVSHYIIQDGPFIKAAEDLIDSGGFAINYYRLPNPTKEVKKPPVFVCEECDQQARGKKDLQVTCSHCKVRMLPREQE